MSFSVEITRRALAEIDQALAWRSKRSVAAAARWHGRLLQAIESLQENPGRCSLAPEDEWYQGGELRQLLYGKRRDLYRVLFEIKGDTVFILRLRHGAQDLLARDGL